MHDKQNPLINFQLHNVCNLHAIHEKKHIKLRYLTKNGGKKPNPKKTHEKNLLKFYWRDFYFFEGSNQHITTTDKYKITKMYWGEYYHFKSE